MRKLDTYFAAANDARMRISSLSPVDLFPQENLSWKRPQPHKMKEPKRLSIGVGEGDDSRSSVNVISSEFSNATVI